MTKTAIIPLSVQAEEAIRRGDFKLAETLTQNQVRKMLLRDKPPTVEGIDAEIAELLTEREGINV